MKIKRILFVVLTIFMIFSVSTSYAANEKYTSIKEKTEIAKVIDPTDNQNAYKPGKASSSKIKGKIGPILGAIRNVGIVVSVISLMIIGLKTILGSAEERAEYKKELPKYVIGILVLLSGSIIPELIYKIMK